MSTDIHPSRRRNLPQSTKPTKRKRPTPTSTTQSTTQLRRQIRSLTRLLSRPNLPPPARVQSERALASYNHTLSRLQSLQNAKKVANKYRMVRFFERQKASRKLRQVIKSLSQNPPVLEAEKDRLLQAQVDLNYTLYFPIRKKYISLYRSSEGDPKTQRSKEEIRKDIMSRMNKGTLGEMTMNFDREEGNGVDIEGEGEGEDGAAKEESVQHEEERHEWKSKKKQRSEDKKTKSKSNKKHKDTNGGETELAKKDDFFAS